MNKTQSPKLAGSCPHGTCSHGTDEHSVELQHRAEGLSAVRRAHSCLAVALEQQPLLLSLQQHQKVLQ